MTDKQLQEVILILQGALKVKPLNKDYFIKKALEKLKGE